MIINTISAKLRVLTVKHSSYIHINLHKIKFLLSNVWNVDISNSNRYEVGLVL